MRVFKLNYFVAAASLTALIMILAFPQAVCGGVLYGLDMSVRIIIPALFPFTVTALFLVKSGGINILSKLFGLPFSVFILSALGGYPSGALLLNDLFKTGRLLKSNAERALFFSINAGPSFVLTAVGAGFMNNRKLGAILLISHIAASFILCIIFGRSIKPEKICVKKDSTCVSDAFVLSVNGAVNSMLGIAGTVSVVSAVYFVLNEILNKDAAKIISAFFEVTLGVRENSGNIILCAFLLGFGGLSVIMQVKYLAKDFSPSIVKILLGRIMHGALNAVLCFIILYFFPVAVETASNNVEFSEKIFFVSLPASLAFLFMCIMFVFTTLRSKLNSDDGQAEHR